MFFLICVRKSTTTTKMERMNKNQKYISVILYENYN